MTAPVSAALVLLRHVVFRSWLDLSLCKPVIHLRSINPNVDY